MSWKDTLRVVAPVLGGAIGGPAGAVATKIIAGALLGNPAARESDVAAVIDATAPDELRVKLRELDQQFERDIEGYALEAQRIDAGDRANARAREIAVKDHIPAILALGLVCAFVCVLVGLVFVAIPEVNRTIFEVILGILSASVGAVVQYYFGSSKGSERKDATISKALDDK